MAFFAILSALAFYVFAGVGNALTILAALTGGAAELVAIFVALGFALAFHADLIGWTSDIGASIEALAVFAELVISAFDARARIFAAHTVLAVVTSGTFVDALFVADPLDAGLALCGGGEVVHCTVTIVIFVVADFGGGLLGATRSPLAVAARFGACSAFALASARDAVVDHPVAIVVFAVANFGGGGGCIATLPFTGVTGFFAVATSGGAFALESVVDLAVAIFVGSVAGFGLGLLRVAILPFPGVTGFFARTTSTLTSALQTFVDLTVAVFVGAIASFGLGLGSIAIHPFTGATCFDTCTASGVAIAGKAFVGFAVAIIVFVVAGFGLGLLCGRASTPLPFGTDLCSRSTGACARATETVVDHAIAIVVEVVADLGACGVCDSGHRCVEFGRVISLIILARSSDGRTTARRHIVEAISVHTRSETDHVGQDPFGVQGRNLCLRARCGSIRQEHDSAFACFDRVTRGHRSEMLIGGGNRGDQVGSTARSKGGERCAQLRTTIGPRCDTLRNTIANRRGAIEGFESKAQFATVLCGDQVDCVDSRCPVGSLHTARTIHNDQQVRRFTSGVCLGRQHAPKKQGQPKSPQGANPSFVFHDHLHEQDFLIDILDYTTKHLRYGT